MSEEEFLTILVTCDHKECGIWNRAVNRERLYSYLRRLGWAFQDGKHYCPDHVASNVRAGTG